MNNFYFEVSMTYNEIKNYVVEHCFVEDGYNGRFTKCMLAYVDGSAYEIYKHGYQKATHMVKTEFHTVEEMIKEVHNCPYYTF